MDINDIKNHSVKTDVYVLQMRPLYALITYNDPSSLEIKILKEIRNHLKKFYVRRDFILINKRMGSVIINPLVYKYALKNIKGIAVVSEHPNLRDQLITEQKAWNRSFAYFRNFRDAKKWALDCFERGA